MRRKILFSNADYIDVKLRSCAELQQTPLMMAPAVYGHCICLRQRQEPLYPVAFALLHCNHTLTPDGLE